MVTQGNLNVSCRRMKKLIIGYHLHTLSDKETKFAENHLKHCEKCESILICFEIGKRIGDVIIELREKGFKLDNLEDELEDIRAYLPDLAKKIKLSPKGIEFMLIEWAERRRKRAN